MLAQTKAHTRVVSSMAVLCVGVRLYAAVGIARVREGGEGYLRGACVCLPPRDCRSFVGVLSVASPCLLLCDGTVPLVW